MILNNLLSLPLKLKNISMGTASSGRRPSDASAIFDLRCKVNETEYYYIKSKALLENLEVQQVMRLLIDKAYEREKRNGIDIIAIAMDNDLL